MDITQRDKLDKYIDRSKGRIITVQVSQLGLKDEMMQHFYSYLFATLYEKYHFGGYDPFYTKTTAYLTMAINYHNRFNRRINSQVLDYLSSWSVKYFVTRSNSILGRHHRKYKNFSLLYSDEEITLLENKYSIPLVYFQEDYGSIYFKPIQFKFGVNYIYIYPENEEEKQIVVNVAPLRWYRLYIDGKNQGPVEYINGRIFINTPKNTKRITIKYIDFPFYVGVVISSTTLLILIVYFIRKRE